MALSTKSLKYIFLIINACNIVGAIAHIVFSFFIYHEGFGQFLALNYLNMILSALFCIASLLEQSWLLEMTANILIAEVTSRLMIWIFVHNFFWNSVYFMIFQGLLVILAYILSHKIRPEYKYVPCVVNAGDIALN